jgi:hypothetical protein
MRPQGWGDNGNWIEDALELAAHRLAQQLDGGQVLTVEKLHPQG